MFDREFQEAIKAVNKEFIAQALERAAAARLEKKPKRITLSPLEGRIANVNTNDVSTEALAQYREIAKIDEAVGSPDFNRRLVQQGLLKQDDGSWIPTGVIEQGGTRGVEVVDYPRNRHVRRIRRFAESSEPDRTEPFEALHRSRIGAEAGFGARNTLRGCQDMSTVGITQSRHLGG